ncbi:RhoGAP-domain-containing protein [Thozetella sp. PMI_491]|nr:RhoGAP-domain-containing protein [Thozetella sp. PMI_491]
MTSAAPHAAAASQQHQHQQPSHPQPHQTPTTMPAQSSPPNKRDLKSWWKGFRLPSKHQEIQAESRPHGIFGVPLRQSITYANVAISLVDENGKSYIYGYVPIVVAKCGVFLKEKATEVEGIFRLSGSEKRIKELKNIFDSPDRYGKGLVWDGYTVHDAANVLRRYLNDLPEPVVPLDLYERFREPLRGATKQAVGDAEGPQFVENFDMGAAIAKYQQLITELPPLNRQLLLYILDLLAVFAAKSDQNRMNSQNLAAIFQPGMLSHPNHAMAPEEYRLNQCVIIFLIENQDHFLIGMQGTAADEKTVQEVQKGVQKGSTNPVIKEPATPSRSSGVVRSSSSASAGAESVAKDGSLRRNKSTSSRRSRQSNGAPSPGSPALATSTGGGLARSNTVPSKKSPALQSGRFQQHNAEHSPGRVAPLTPVSPTAPPLVQPPTVVEEIVTPPADEPGPSLGSTDAPHGAHNQDRLLEPTLDAATPSKERKLPAIFQRSPTGDSENFRQPNKLRKKKFGGSTNPSAQSSTSSLPYSAAVSPSFEVPNPLEEVPSPPPASTEEKATSEKPQTETPSEPTPRASQVPTNASGNSLHPHSAENTLKPKKSPPSSIHSSFNEGSDLDQFDEQGGPAAPADAQDKEKKKRWRLSRRKEDLAPAIGPVPTSPNKMLGQNQYAEVSSSTVGSSGQKARRSFTGESSDPTIMSGDGTSLNESFLKDGKEDSKGLTGWIKNKVREHNLKKENKETEKRNKSPPADRSLGAALLPARGKSMDIPRPPPQEEEKITVTTPEEPHGPH